MEKRISFYEFQSVKSVAKACDPIIKKRNKVKEQIAALAEEYKSYDAQIRALEAGVVQIVGLHVEDLVKKVIETDAKGNKVTKYLPTNRVTYDADKKQYVISDNSVQDDGALGIGEEVSEREAAESEAEDNFEV